MDDNNDISVSLSTERKVYKYLDNWDRSHGYRFSLGIPQVGSRLIVSYIKEMFNLPCDDNWNQILPKKEDQIKIITGDFEKFRLWLNSKHKDNTLNNILTGK